MSDTPQGEGWWQASDGKFYAPEQHPDYVPPAPPPPPPTAAPPAPQVVPPPPGAIPPAPSTPGSGRKIWPWVLLGVLVLFVGGCGVLIVAIGTAVDDVDDRNREALAQTSCRVVGIDFADDVKVELTVENSTSKRSDFWVDYEVLDGNGTFLGDGFAVLGNVPAGQTFTEEHFTIVPAPGGSVAGVTCRPIDVSRFASN